MTLDFFAENKNKISSYTIAVLSFLFPLTFLTQRGFSVATGLVALIGVFMYFKNTAPYNVLRKNKVKKIFIYILIINLSLLFFFVLENIYYKNSISLKNLNATEFYARFVILSPLFLVGALVNFSLISFLRGIVLTLVLMATYSFYQLHYEGLSRSFGFYNYENLYACVQFVFCIIILLNIEKINILTAAIGLSSGVCSVILTGTRGVWLLLPFILIWFCYIGYKKISEQKNQRTQIPNLTLVTIFLMMTILTFLVLPQIKHRIENSKKEVPVMQAKQWHESSIGTRLDLWTVGFDMANKNGIVGGGWGSFKEELVKLAQENKIPASYAMYQGPHNLYILLIAEHGYLLGFAVMFFIFVFPILMLLKNNYNIKYIVVFLASCAVFFMSESILERQSGMQWFGSFWLLFFGYSTRAPAAIDAKS
jgi:O-antigen ligase